MNTASTVGNVLPLRAMHMSLYPTYDNLTEAVARIEAQCPLDTPNKVFTALMGYHNTLIKELDAENRQVQALLLCVQALDALMPELHRLPTQAPLIQEALQVARPLLKKG